MVKILSFLLIIILLSILNVFAQNQDTYEAGKGDKSMVDSSQLIPAKKLAITSREQMAINNKLLDENESFINEIKKLKTQLNDINWIYLPISGFLLLLIIIAAIVNIRSLAKIKRRLAQQKKEFERLSFQISGLSTSSISAARPVSVTQETPLPIYHQPSDIESPPSAKKIYFGGPSKEGYFLTEYQSETMVPSLSLFEFTISIHDPSFATFIPIPNEYTVGTIAYNLDTFERVCEIRNFSSNARNMEIIDAGKAILQGGIWKVTDKATIRLS